MKRENDEQLTPSRPRRLIGSAPSGFFEAGDAVLAPKG
jgi:hypothetical protein